MDMDSLEVYFMNDAARKFTGVYNYFGAKCYQVFSGGTKKCTGCMINVDGADKEEHFTGKMLYEFCGEHMGVREKIIKWDGRDMKLVVAWPLDEDSRLLAEKFSTETYTLEQIVDMYAMAAEKQSEPDLMKGILDFAGRFYQADRVCLFLHDEQLDVWQDVLAYHDKGIMDKKRYFELTTSRVDGTVGRTVEQGKSSLHQQYRGIQRERKCTVERIEDAEYFYLYALRDLE